MAKTEAIIAIIGAVGAFITSKPFRKAMFGTYTDGTTRSLTDALDGEFRSPSSKQRKKSSHKGGKKKKSKSKKKNNNFLEW